METHASIEDLNGVLKWSEKVEGKSELGDNEIARSQKMLCPITFSSAENHIV